MKEQSRQDQTVQNFAYEYEMYQLNSRDEENEDWTKVDKKTAILVYFTNFM